MGKLIRLELFNFKSYKGHHVLPFDDSYFTSIIGPNGSGKSNSMDAISFVLGIKSSHLRSSHLRDLVYRGRVLRTAKIGADGSAIEGDLEVATNGVHTNGDNKALNESNGSSQRHDPNTAWVMAVYEDDTGDEQKWKRSITAAGHSEYWINNRVVSAKRYNDALEAENILIKARNFLVFQGDVEAIASQSPRDLTRLVEQISGSVEYKNDYDRLKADSEKALEEQTFRLNQRRGMNFEIKQYQEQKKEADNYSRKVDERDQAIVTHVLWKLFQFQRVIDESEADIQKHQEELKEYKRSVEKSEHKLDESRKEQAKVGRDVSQVERVMKKKEKEMEEKSNSLVPINEKIAISRKNLEKYHTRITEVTKEADSQNKTLDQLKKELATVQKAQSRWETEWAKATQKSGKQLSEADLQEYTKMKSEVTKRSASAQASVDQISRQVRTESEMVTSLKSKVEAAEDQKKRLKEEMQAIVDRKSKLDSSVKDITKDIEAKKKSFHAFTSERLRTAQMQTELEEKLQDVLNKLIEGESGRRQSEKEIRARETLVAMKRIFPGVRGRIVELCKPKQKRYETAVSTIFGRHHDSIVVDTEKVAKECIQYLRDQRLGQATFIPLDSIQVNADNSNIRGLHKGVRLATDVIEYDSSVERAMSYVCGNAVVCDDLNVAKYICYQKNIGVKAVTLDGTIIHKGGLMTGGRGPNDRNERRWEEAELEALRQMKDKFLGEIAALPKMHRKGAEEEALQGELAGLEQQLKYVREELRSLDRNAQSKGKELEFVNSQLAEARPKYDEQSRRLQNLQQKLDGHQSEIGKVEDNVFGSFCKRLGYKNIRDYEAQQGGLQQEAAQKKLEFTTQRSKLENQLSFETQRLQATQDRVKSLKDQAKRDEQLVASLMEEKESLEEEVEEQQSEIEELQAQLGDVKAKYAERSEKVSELRRELQKRSKTVEGTLKAVTDLEEIIQKQAAGRYAQLRRSKIDEIKIPLADESQGLEALPLDDILGAEPNADAMEIDEQPDASMQQMGAVQDYGIVPDYDELEEDLREDTSPTCEENLLEKINALSTEIEGMAPNMRAVERLETVQTRLRNCEKEFEAAKEAAKRAKEEFEDVKEQRLELFNKAFGHISEQIDHVYKELTRNPAFPMGGNAYLDTEESDEPYTAGLKYHAMPPLKRFRDMEHLSGGEKTMAALALLFAVHSYQPSPFFVLDEVDAALDNANVARIAGYIRDHAGPGMQFIVISLKAGLFQCSETLVGIMRDQEANSSRALTLDLRKYQPA